MSPAALWRSCLLAACLSFVLFAPALAQDSATPSPTGNTVPSAQVKIGSAEVLPNIITVTVGAQVFWNNEAGQPILLSDRSFSPDASDLYLPLVASDIGLAAASVPTLGDAARPAAWISEPIAPSGQFSRTFDQAGAFPYYMSHLTATVGTVVVLSDTLAATVLVDAASGGVVEAGGSRLEIPPGALAEDTTVVLSQPLTGMSMQVDGMQAARLEPAGLQLNRPATLTINYGETGSYDEDLLEVIAYHQATDAWEPQTILAQDKGTHQAAIQTTRFAYWLAYSPDPLYISLDIPGKYLKPGDVLATLSGSACTGKANWFPGRTAIFSSTVTTSPFDPGTSVVIEAAPGEANQLGCATAGEVRERDLYDFTHQACQYSLGALYHPAADGGQMTAAAAVARGQLGRGYLAVGQGNWAGNCLSCTGLVEYAYRKAGAGIVAASPRWPITPLQLTRKLRPVDEITVNAEEVVQMQVVTLHWVDDAAGGHYTADSIAPQATLLPPGSHYDSFFGNYTWQPSRAQGGKSYPLQLVAQLSIGDEQRTVTRTLTIHVNRLSNVGPVAGDDFAAATEGTTTMIDVLADDSDADSDPLTITAVSTSAHGRAAVADDGLSVLYTPNAGYLGSDAFTYTVSDGALTATGIVTVTVMAADIDGSEMVFIPAGPFQMGCDPANPAEDGCSGYMQTTTEQLHTVNLSAYFIDKYEVTNARYKACVNAGVCTVTHTGSWSVTDYYDNPAYADYPVLYLIWEQAKTFCAWEGKRLPTEAEWEKAARGGSDTRKYPWGNEEPDCGKANFARGDYPQDECVGDTARVGSYPSGASPYGVMDMAGNVTEWVNDRFAGDYYSKSPLNDPQGPETGTRMVVRGGAWDYYSPRVAVRYGSDMWSAGTAYLGFRCARSQ